MASLPIGVRAISVADYVRAEEAAFHKSEYFDGQVVAMSGGSPNHALLGGRLVYLLTLALRSRCRIFNSELRIRIEATNSFLYPDCSVVCGEMKVGPGQSILNPLLIVEVLPPSTGDFGRGQKFDLYKMIDSLNEYVIIHQDRILVQVHSRQSGGGWLLQDFRGREASARIPSLDVDLPLADLYEGCVGLLEP